MCDQFDSDVIMSQFMSEVNKLAEKHGSAKDVWIATFLQDTIAANLSNNQQFRKNIVWRTDIMSTEIE